MAGSRSSFLVKLALDSLASDKKNSNSSERKYKPKAPEGKNPDSLEICCMVTEDTIIEPNGDSHKSLQLKTNTGQECSSSVMEPLYDVQPDDTSNLMLLEDNENNILQEAELKISGNNSIAVQPWVLGSGSDITSDITNYVVNSNGELEADEQNLFLDDHSYNLLPGAAKEQTVSLPLTDDSYFLLNSNIDLEPDNILDSSLIEIDPITNLATLNSSNNDLLNNDLINVAFEEEVISNNDINYEPSSDNSSSSDESGGNANCSRELQHKRKRAKRGRAEKEKWTAESNKIKRMKGEDYEGRRKNEEGKTVFDVKRPKRSIKSRCSCKETKKNKFKCYRISEERRKYIFEHFWDLDWSQRKIEVYHLVDRNEVKQRTVSSTESKRKISLQYHLKPLENSDRIRVCKKMFLDTLGVGEWMIRNWTLKNEIKYNEEETNEDDPDTPENEVINDTESIATSITAKTRKDSSDRNARKLIKEFFDNLPKLESHYCRRDTKKLYLEPCWQSKSQLYREYKSYCESKEMQALIRSPFTFHEVFENCNLAIFSPKKDQCDLCCAFKQGNVSEEEYNSHIERKNKAREAKSKDKDESDENTAVFTMDVQAVLLCPSLKASALYYKKKLKVHNFTLYNLKSHEGYCYLWDESEGGVSADEFSTILHNFITTELDLNKIKHVILYSDGCTSQNRNATMANALLIASHHTGVTITQKYLEKGHTQMECDSIHSNIEKKMRNREIYSPAGYIEICKTARLKPQPYKVVQLEHTFFKLYNKLTIVSSIRPGKKKGDPCVTDLRCIQYCPDVTMKVKLSPQGNFFDLPQRIRPAQASNPNLGPLYKARIPIDAVKYQHLQELKSVIPKEIHCFYDNLPHQ